MATSGSFTTSYYKNLCMKITWEVKERSIENNTSTIAWSLQGERSDTAWGSITCGAFKVVINGVTVYSKAKDYRIDVYNGTEIANGQLTIAHEADGSKSFSASAEAAIYYSSVNVSGNDTFTLDPIPRKSTLSADDGTLGTPQTLTIERHSTSFTHTITYTCGSESGTVCDKSSSASVSFTPPLALAEQNTSGVSVKIVFTLITYNGNAEIGRTEKTIACAIPESVKPTCSLSVSDARGHYDTYGGYVKGQSTFKVDVTAEGSYGSSITSIKTIANGETRFEASFVTDVLKNAGAQTISVIVTDSRGRTETASVDVTVQDYAAPKVSKCTTVRCNSDGTANDQGEYVKVIFSATVTSLQSTNAAIYRLKYKKTTDTSYTTVELHDYYQLYTVTNGTYIFAAKTGSSYDVSVTINDAFCLVERATSAPTAFTLMHWKADGTAVGIGKVAEKTYTLDLGVDIELNDNTILKDGVDAFYGLGKKTPPLLSDANVIIPASFFRVTSSTANLNNTTHWGGIVMPYSSNEAVQFLVRTTTGLIRVRRTQNGTTWYDEYINPLKNVGNEYCSTERYEGEAVYVKHISHEFTSQIGSDSGSGEITIAHGISGFGKLVRIVVTDWSGYQLPYFTSAGGFLVVKGVNATNITLRYYKATLAAREMYFDLYYIK